MRNSSFEIVNAALVQMYAEREGEEGEDVESFEVVKMRSMEQSFYFQTKHIDAAKEMDSCLLLFYRILQDCCEIALIRC